jgi:hypothetical protein
VKRPLASNQSNVSKRGLAESEENRSGALPTSEAAPQKPVLQSKRRFPIAEESSNFSFVNMYNFF